MKNLLLLIFALVSSLLHSQKNSIENDSISLGTCEEGIENAKSDFKKNIYNSKHQAHYLHQRYVKMTNQQQKMLKR